MNGTFLLHSAILALNLTFHPLGSPTSNYSSGILAFKMSHAKVVKEVGSVVWCKLNGFPWWPAMIIDQLSFESATQVSGQDKTANTIFIFWYGQRTVSKVNRNSQILGFREGYRNLKPLNKRNCQLHNAVGEAISDIKLFNRSVEAIEWPLIIGLWKSHLVPKKLIINEKNPNGEVSDFVKCELQKLGNSNKKGQPAPSSIRERHIIVNKNSDCISCHTAENYCELKDHPLFQAKLCDTCLEKLIANFFAVGVENIPTHCAICTTKHEEKPAVCFMPFCYRSYCPQCNALIRSSLSSEEHGTLKTFICILCQPYDETSHSSLKPWTRWKENIRNLQFIKNVYELPETEGKELDVLISHNGWKTVLAATKILKWNVGRFHQLEGFNVNGLLSPLAAGILILDDSDEKLLVQEFMTAFFLLQDIREKNTSLSQSRNDILWLFGLPTNISHECHRLISRFLECYPQTWNTSQLPKESQLVWTNMSGLRNELKDIF